VTGTALRQGARHATVAAGAVFMLGPIVLMLAASFTPTSDIVAGHYLAHFTLENYRVVARQVPLGRYYRSSLVVCLATLLLQLMVCVPAAYAMARLRYHGRGISYIAVSGLVLVPFQVIAIPLYLMFRSWGLLDTYTALVLPFVGSAFALFLLRQFFLSIPSVVFDSARIDGASPTAMILQVVVPCSRPALASLSILTVTSAWNAYFWPSFVLTGSNSAVGTIPFGVLAFLNSESGTDYGPQMAMATLSVLPLVFAFLCAQRPFINGLSLTGQA
jgi:multiple sugar transport system permease protein